MKPLYKTTIVIWSDFEPSHLELEDLARDATSGESFCSRCIREAIQHPEMDEYPPDEEFFLDGEEEE